MNSEGRSAHLSLQDISSDGRRTRLSWATRVGLAIVACLAVMLTGCAIPASRDIGIGASDVDHVEVYLYSYSAAPGSVTRSIVKDRREIEQLVIAFTDMPVTALSHSASELAGHQTAGLRFVLREGGTVELTQVFLGPRDVVVFWQDGTVVDTSWGAAIGSWGTPSKPSANVSVDPSQRPKAVVP